MDYCPSCRRHLNGALACPGCGAPAGFPHPAPGRPVPGHAPGPGPAPYGRPAGGPAPGSQAPPPVPQARQEQAYRAQPFPHEPPPGLYADEQPPAAEAVDHGGHEAPSDETDAAPSGRGARRHHGRRARRGRGKRVVILAACLGTVLLGLTVTEIGAPELPWSERQSTGPDTQAVGASESRSGKPKDEASSGAPTDEASADASRTPDSDPSSASPSAEPSPEESQEPSPEPTQISGSVAPEPSDPGDPEPEPTSADPTPPQDDPDPPDDDDDGGCWLIFCR